MKGLFNVNMPPYTTSIMQRIQKGVYCRRNDSGGLKNSSLLALIGYLSLSTVSPFLLPMSPSRSFVGRSYASRHQCFQQNRFATIQNAKIWGVSLRATTDDEFVKGEDLEALQALFSKYCGSEGLMTKIEVMQISAIEELLVRCCNLTYSCFYDWSRTNLVCSRSTPRQCRITTIDFGDQTDVK